jgi:hypothetical protein
VSRREKGKYQLDSSVLAQGDGCSLHEIRGCVLKNVLKKIEAERERTDEGCPLILWNDGISCGETGNNVVP